MQEIEGSKQETSSPDVESRPSWARSRAIILNKCIFFCLIWSLCLKEHTNANCCHFKYKFIYYCCPGTSFQLFPGRKPSLINFYFSSSPKVGGRILEGRCSSLFHPQMTPLLLTSNGSFIKCNCELKWYWRTQQHSDLEICYLIIIKHLIFFLFH